PRRPGCAPPRSWRSRRAAASAGPRSPRASPNRSARPRGPAARSEEHTSELQSRENLVCRLLLEKKNLSNSSVITRTFRYYSTSHTLASASTPDATSSSFRVSCKHTPPPEISTLSLHDALPISLGDQDARRLDRGGHVGQQRPLVPDHLELHPIVQPGRAGQPRVAHRLLHRVAARRVGEDEDPLGIQVIEDPLLLGPVEVHAAHRDRHHLRAGRL